MERTYRIIKLLLEKDRTLTINEIAGLMGVSNRTVRNDLNKVDDYLKDKNLVLIRKPSVGIGIEGSEDDKSRLLQTIEKNRDIDNEPYSPKARCYHILKRLLLNQDFITIKEFAYELYVSRGTIQSDLESAEKWLSGFDLELVRKANYGVKVEGDEKNHRLAIASLIILGKDELDDRKESLSDISRQRIDRKTVLKLKELIDIDYDRLEQIISGIETNLGFAFSDEAFTSLLIHTAIAMKRFQENTNAPLISADILEELKGRDEYLVAKQAADEIERCFNVVFPEQEIGYMLLHILGAKMQQNSAYDINWVSKLIPDDDIVIEMAIEIIHIAESALNIELKNDEQLLNGLILHLRPTINRLEYGLTIKNPMLEEIKSSYPDIFGAAWIASTVFDKYLHKKINEEEIGYIALHLGAAIERNRKPLKALIVCASGIGISQLLKAKIDKQFSQLETIGVASSISYETDIGDDVDVIISTIPITANRPVLLVSPLLSQNDIRKIDNYINNTSKLQGLPLFSEEMMEINASGESKEQVIHSICQRLFEKKYIREGFEESIYAREEICSTEIGNGVALCHGLAKYVDRSVVAFYKLDKPVGWGDENVDLVFMFVFSERDSKKSVRYLGGFYKRLASEDFALELRQLKSSKGAKDLFVRICEGR